MRPGLGAHFAFSPALPDCAVTAGADLVVLSGHKTLTAFSQGALLHAVDRGFVDLDRLDAAIEALLTIGDDRQSVDRLIEALRRSLARRAGTATSPAVAGTSWRTVPQPALSPRDAFFAPRERVPADRAAGRVTAEIVSPTHPASPPWSPGAGHGRAAGRAPVRGPGRHPHGRRRRPDPGHPAGGSGLRVRRGGGRPGRTWPGGCRGSR